MLPKRRKYLVDMPGLPVPWLAYMHVGKKRVFFHNTVTKESVWELPADVRSRCASSIDELGAKLDETFTAHVVANQDVEDMDCAEWTGDSPADDPSTSVFVQNECEAMDVDYTQNLRQMRCVKYDSSAIPSVYRYVEISKKLMSSSKISQNGTLFDPADFSRSCVVFDTCALIDDPDLIDNCIERNVSLVIPYRVFYELDGIRKASSSSQLLHQRATKVVHKLRDLRTSPLVHWESSSQSFAPVDGFKTSSAEDINDDFILKCAFLVKTMLDARGEGWETVFLTNDQVLSLKAHANNIPSFNGKEAKAALKAAPLQPINRTGSKADSLLKRERVSSSGSLSLQAKNEQNKLTSATLGSTNLAQQGLKKRKTTILLKKKAPKSGKDPIRVLTKIWNTLVSNLKKSHTENPEKNLKTIDRLRESVANFCAKPCEKNLSSLVRCILWTFRCHFPSTSEKDSTTCEELMNSGLFQQLTASNRRSQKLMKQLCGFNDVFGATKKEIS